MAVQGSPTHSEDFSYVADSAALVAHSGGFTFLGSRQCGWPKWTALLTSRDC